MAKLYVNNTILEKTFERIPMIGEKVAYQGEYCTVNDVRWNEDGQATIYLWQKGVKSNHDT